MNERKQSLQDFFPTQRNEETKLHKESSKSTSTIIAFVPEGLPIIDHQFIGGLI